jgi:hypothetical protein
MNQHLDYRAPDPGSSGCGEIVLQLIGGIAFAFFCHLTAGSLGAWLPIPRLAVYILVLSLGLAATIYLALKRRPGYAIGYILSAGCFGLLASACGYFLR